MIMRILCVIHWDMLPWVIGFIVPSQHWNNTDPLTAGLCKGTWPVWTQAKIPSLARMSIERGACQYKVSHVRCQYRGSHYRDMKVSLPPYLYHGSPTPGKNAFILRRVQSGVRSENGCEILIAKLDINILIWVLHVICQHVGYVMHQFYRFVGVAYF